MEEIKQVQPIEYALASIAISLKRIADILTPTHDIMMTPEEVAVHKKSFE